VLAIIILLPLLFGTGLVSCLSRAPRRLNMLAAISISLSCFGLLLSQSNSVFHGATLLQTWAWLPEIGINFSFRLDALGLLFGLLISGIGTLIFIYAYYYLGEKTP
jgi:multicomponent K+:H+ antiporter subunit A